MEMYRTKINIVWGTQRIVVVVVVVVIIIIIIIIIITTTTILFSSSSALQPFKFVLGFPHNRRPFSPVSSCCTPISPHPHF